MNTKELMMELYRRYKAGLTICTDIDCKECPFLLFNVCPNDAMIRLRVN